MADRSRFTQQVFSSRVPVPATNYVGDSGRIFWNEDTGELRISDGVTPHGRPIYFAGGGGGTGVALNLYKETGNPSVVPVPSGDRTIAMGDGSYAQVPGSLMFASGVFSHLGDAQVGSYVARGVSTNSAYIDLFLDGNAAKLLIPQNTSMAFVITLMARRTDAGAEGAVYEIHGGIDRLTSTLSTRIIGQVSKHVVSEDSPLWDVEVDADTTSGALRIKVKGEAGKTIRWVAHVRSVEVKT